MPVYNPLTAGNDVLMTIITDYGGANIFILLILSDNIT